MFLRCVDLPSHNLPSLNPCTDDDLTAIIDALLAIPLADKLYTPNSRKTTMLAMWGLSSLRVPSPIFAPLAPKFVDATTRALEGKLGKGGKKGAGCEALSVRPISISVCPS